MTRAVRARLGAIAGKLRAAAAACRSPAYKGVMASAAAGIDETLGPGAKMGRPRFEVTREQCVAALAEAGSTRAAAELLTSAGLPCSEPLLRARIAGTR